MLEVSKVQLAQQDALRTKKRRVQGLHPHHFSLRPEQEEPQDGKPLKSERLVGQPRDHHANDQRGAHASRPLPQERAAVDATAGACPRPRKQTQRRTSRGQIRIRCASGPRTQGKHDGQDTKVRCKGVLDHSQQDQVVHPVIIVNGSGLLKDAQASLNHLRESCLQVEPRLGKELDAGINVQDHARIVPTARQELERSSRILKVARLRTSVLARCWLCEWLVTRLAVTTFARNKGVFNTRRTSAAQLAAFAGVVEAVRPEQTPWPHGTSMKTVLPKKPCQILGKQFAQLPRINRCHGGAIDTVDLALENTVGSALVTAASLENGAPAPVTEKGCSLANRLLKFILSTQHTLVQTLFEDAIVIKEPSYRAVSEH